MLFMRQHVLLCLFWNMAAFGVLLLILPRGPGVLSPKLGTRLGVQERLSLHLASDGNSLSGLNEQVGRRSSRICRYIPK